MGGNFFTKAVDVLTDIYDVLEEDREREILNDHALSNYQKTKYITRMKFIIQHFRKTSYDHYVMNCRDCKELLKQN